MPRLFIVAELAEPISHPSLEADLKDQVANCLVSYLPLTAQGIGTENVSILTPSADVEAARTQVCAAAGVLAHAQHEAMLDIASVDARAAYKSAWDVLAAKLDALILAASQATVSESVEEAKSRLWSVLRHSVNDQNIEDAVHALIVAVRAESAEVIAGLQCLHDDQAQRAREAEARLDHKPSNPDDISAAVAAFDPLFQAAGAVKGKMEKRPYLVRDFTDRIAMMEWMAERWSRGYERDSIIGFPANTDGPNITQVVMRLRRSGDTREAEVS